VTPAGRASSPAWTDVPISIPSTLTFERARDVGGLGLHGDLHQLLVKQAAGEHLPGHLDLHVDGDFSAPADHDQVHRARPIP